MTQLTQSLSLWWGSISFERERVWIPSAIDPFNYLTRNLLKSSDTTNRSDFGIFRRSIIQSRPHRSRWPQIRRSSLSLSLSLLRRCIDLLFISHLSVSHSAQTCVHVYCLDISQMIETDNSIFDRSFFSFFLSLARCLFTSAISTKQGEKDLFLLIWFCWREER